MLLRALLLLGSLLLVLAGPAGASTASQSATVLQIQAGAGEINRITFPEKDVVEDLAGITPGFGGCAQQTPTRLSCKAVREINAMLGDGDDTYTAAADLPVVADGGPGADTIVGSAGADVLLGGPSGAPGRDTLRAGEGDDLIEADDGKADVVDCGGGAADRAFVDAIDAVTGCESIRVDGRDPSAPPPPGFDALPACAGARTVQLIHREEDGSGGDQPVATIPATGRYAITVLEGGEALTDVRLTVAAPAYLFATFRSTGVRTLTGSNATVVTDGPGPLALLVEWVPPRLAEAERCRAAQRFSLPVRQPCAAQLLEPARFATTGGFQSGRGPNALGPSGLRLSFGGCSGQWSTATYDVRAYAVAGTRTPGRGGRVSRRASHEQLALAPISTQAFTRRVRRRQARAARLNPFVELGDSDFTEDQIARRLPSVLANLTPPGAPPGRPERGRAMTVLFVAHDRRGRPVGPRWLVRVRPDGRLQRRAPKAFRVSITRARGS